MQRSGDTFSEVAKGIRTINPESDSLEKSNV